MTVVLSQIVSQHWERPITKGHRDFTLNSVEDAHTFLYLPTHAWEPAPQAPFFVGWIETFKTLIFGRLWIPISEPLARR